MAEILAAIAFPIAAYQTIEKFYEFGKFVHEKIKTFRDAPDEVQRIQVFMEDMYDGELRKDMERTEWIFNQQDVTKFMKARVSDSFESLKKELCCVDKILKKAFDPNGNIHRTKYTWKYGPVLKESIKSLDKWRNDFWAELARLSTERQLPDPLLLTSPIPFAPRSQKWNVSFEPGCSLTLGYAEISHKNTIRDITVLIEQVQKLGPDGLPTVPHAAIQSTKEREAILQEAKAIAAHLAQKLQSPNKGVLRCLGYRDSPAVDLIFEVPNGYCDPRSLRFLITRGRGGRTGDLLAPLEYRFRLARELVTAVYSINAAGYVHKSIRPDSIVTFSKGNPKGSQAVNSAALAGINFNAIGQAYLMDWRMLRKQDMGSNRYGDEEWTKNFYRHEDRQGIEPQKRYDTKHDVYSLGVCLLEVGLWESFIVEKDGTRALSDFFLAAALEYGHTPKEKFKDTDPKTSAEEKYKKMNAFCATGKLKDVFVAIAQAYLPQHMGSTYSRLVVKCLENIEGGFGNPKDFEGDQAVLNFQKLILDDESLE